MSNIVADAYALTLICPIKNGNLNHSSFSALTRRELQALDIHEYSPLAKVPNTYLARFYILNDVFFEGSPALEDHLKSNYLVFSANFHGALEPWLAGFWQHAPVAINNIWQYCVAFDQVHDEQTFIDYIKKCQLDTTFFFNGSSGAPLAEQLKALYLKQEFTRFVIDHQGDDAATLQKAFKAFVAESKPSDLSGPTWEPGKHTL